MHPLPMRVTPSESGESIALLHNNGIRSATFDPEAMIITVADRNVEQATMIVAREEVPEDNRHRAATIAGLLRELVEVEDARVIFGDAGRRSLFAVRQGPTASVVVHIRAGSAKTAELVETIALLVAAAKTGMRPENVTVSDAHGRVLHPGALRETDPAAERHARSN